MDTPEPPSKSAKKREMHELQAVGEQLLELPMREFNALDLPETLQDALHLARRLRRGEAHRRQIQYIGKLMRSLDTEPLRHALDRHTQVNTQEREAFHALEQWRSSLIQDGDAAINRLLKICPDADRQQLRQLVRAARRERDEQKSPSAARKLFKYLKSLDFPRDES